MKDGFGLVTERRSFTWSKARSMSQPNSFIAYAITVEAERLTPILQCTRHFTPAFLGDKSSIKAHFHGMDWNVKAEAVFLHTWLWKWTCRCHSNTPRGLWPPRHTLGCCGTRKAQGRNCQSLASHSGCSELWGSGGGKINNDCMQPSGCICLKREAWNNNVTYPLLWSSSRFEAFHSEPWKHKQKSNIIFDTPEAGVSKIALRGPVSCRD